MKISKTDLFIPNNITFGSKNKISKLITSDVFLKKIKELTITSYYINDDVIKNLDKLELLGITNNQRLYGNDSLYLKFIYKNNNNEECIKFSEFYPQNRGNEYNGNIPLLSKKELKTKNIIKKTNYEIIDKFTEIINSMNCDESFKTLLKNYINRFDILTRIPILYFDDELNKNIWVIPTCENNGEDITLDYETEVPIFNSLFNDYFDRNKNKSFVILRKENIECISITQFDKVNILIEELPNQFVFNYTKDLFNIENVISKNRDIKSLLPNIRFINEEKTEKILKMSESKKSLQEIQKTVNERINNYTGFNEDMKLNDDIEIKYENNLFISENFDFFKNFEDAKLANKSNIDIDLTNLLVIKKENEQSPSLSIYNTQKKSINITNENFLNNIRLEDIKQREYYTINTGMDLELLIPKDKSGSFSILKDLNKNNNLSKMLEKNVMYHEDKFLVNKSKDNGGKVYNIGEILNIKDNELIETDNYKELIVFRNNLNNNIIAVNKLTKEYQIIDNSQRFKKLMDLDIESLKLKMSKEDFDVLFTDNKTFYFECKKDIASNPKQTIDYDYQNKNDKGNYMLTFLFPIQIEKNHKKIIHKKDKKYFYQDTKIKKGKRVVEILKEDINSDILELNYELDNNYDILNLSIDNKIKLNKIDTMKLINKIKDFQEKDYFKIKEDNNNFFIDISNNQDKIKIVKNKKINYSLCNFNNDKNQENFLNLYSKNKLQNKIFNKSLNKNIFFNDDKMFLTDIENVFNGKDVFDFDLKETKNDKESLLNNQESKTYNFKKEIYEIVSDISNKIFGAKNKTLEQRNKNFFKTLDISF